MLARELQDPLYFANLDNRGNYLREYSSKQLSIYISYLKQNQNYLKSFSNSMRFLWKLESIQSNYIKVASAYAILISIPQNIDKTDEEPYKTILNDILEGSIRTLYYYEVVKGTGNEKKKKRIKILDIFEDDQVLIVDKLPQSEILYPDISDLKINRELQAFSKLIDKPDKEMIPLLMLSVRQQYAEWEDMKEIDEPDWKLLTDDTIKGVTAQREAVKKALATPDFAIIEGPPGSGKTTVISEIILHLVEEGKRVLVVASTHVAVDNVLERLVKFEDIVVPIRIAPRDRNLPKEIEKLTYDQYVSTFKDDLIHDLSAKKDRSKVENDWLLSIQGNSADTVIQELLDSTINVVCGTTIGVLQYPRLKHAITAGRFDSVFDVMIIDEASKTTFTEFLVPAIYARKWIISGDPKQLSPFVEQNLIEEQVKGILADIYDKWYKNDDKGFSYKEFEQVCLSASWAINCIEKKKDEKKISALLPSRGQSRNYSFILETQLKSLNSELIIHNSTRQFRDATDRCIYMNSADVLLEDINSLGSYLDCIPIDASPLPGFQIPRVLKYRQNYLYHQNDSRIVSQDGLRDGNSREDSLASQISWRIIRAYELKSLPERSMKYRKEVKQLLPARQDVTGEVEKKIANIETISLPSVIEALIMGIDRRSGGSVLVSGFDERLKKTRWQRLTHQLRMHPDISYFARKFVYSDSKGNALSLMDGKVNRDWSFQRYAKRVSWINVNGKEQRSGKHGGVWNSSEVDAVMEEVGSFVGWAEKNGKPDGSYWDVAVLTFYDKQTSELRARLQGTYGGKGSYITLSKRNVKLFVGNVDSMQGREADIVFLSMVRTKHAGFLDSPNRLNVAITRSRYQLVILGDHSFFKRLDDDFLVTKLANEIKPEFKMAGNQRGMHDK
jgi:superfamily I DNA and/or RNA helicase